MPDRDWRERNAFVAIGALLGGSILFAIVLSIWSGYPLYDRVGQPDSPATEYAQEQQGPAEGHWWPEFAARDTYAQWAMTILAFGALAISLIGIRLLRNTFVETKRTADEAMRATIFLSAASRRIGVRGSCCENLS